MPSDTGTQSPAARSASMFERRMLWLGVAMVAVVGVMAARLFSLTIVGGAQALAVAEGRMDRSTLLPTVRGAITDRKGRVLAESVPSYDLAVQYAAISGAWVDSRAVAAAKKDAGRAAWNKLGPADREARILEKRRGFQAELDGVQIGRAHV